jgi:hypothetical protein
LSVETCPIEEKQGEEGRKEYGANSHKSSSYRSNLRQLSVLASLLTNNHSPIKALWEIRICVNLAFNYHV